jgi:hypothetical protein
MIDCAMEFFMIEIKLIETELGVSTGPIDDPIYTDAGHCPKCGMNSLYHYPDQSGPCHSGIFINRYKEHYACDNDECLSVFVEHDAA